MSRWDEFTREELAVVSAGLADLAESILDGLHPAMCDHHRRLAGMSFLTTMELLFAIDDHYGDEHPPASVPAQIAGMILDGRIPELIEARQMAREGVV